MNTTAKRRTAAEIIAFHFCMDMADVSEGRYQPTRYSSPAVYVLSDDYYCSPAAGGSPPKGFNWKKIGTQYGRDIFKALGSDPADI